MNVRHPTGLISSFIFGHRPRAQTSVDSAHATVVSATMVEQVQLLPAIELDDACRRPARGSVDDWHAACLSSSNRTEKAREAPRNSDRFEINMALRMEYLIGNFGGGRTYPGHQVAYDGRNLY